MKQNYFIANGVKYYTGSVFITNNMGKHTEASFIYYDTDKNRYVYKIKECVWHMDEKNFWRMFVSVTDKINEKVHMPITKTRKDFDISGLPLGWLWYVFLMVISTIFNGAIVFWILISIIFFNWRANKIKEEGTYIEW